MTTKKMFVSREDSASKQLWQAVLDNNVERLEEALRLPVDIDALHGDADEEGEERPEGTTLLHLAACYGNLAVMRCLIQHGAQVDRLNGDRFGDYAPIHDAARCGHADAIRLLLDAGANPHTHRLEVGTPLKSVLYGSRFAYGAQQDAIAVLLDAGLDINEPANEYGTGTLVSKIMAATILHANATRQVQQAVMTNNKQLVEWLVSRGASIEGTLEISARAKYLEMTKWLVEAGAQDAHASAFAIAVLVNRIDICEILWPSASTASPEELAKALTDAARSSRTQSTSYLLDLGLDINQKNGRGITALAAACHAHRPDPEFIKLLLNRGADDAKQEPEIQDKLRRLLGHGLEASKDD